jgi:hypothetical protein
VDEIQLVGLWTITKIYVDVDVDGDGDGDGDGREWNWDIELQTSKFEQEHAYQTMSRF